MEELPGGSLEERLNLLSKKEGVKGYLLIASDGGVVQSSLSAEDTKKHAQAIAPLLKQLDTAVKTIDAQNEPQFLRLKTRTNELMIWPDKNVSVIVVYKGRTG